MPIDKFDHLLIQLSQAATQNNCSNLDLDSEVIPMEMASLSLTKQEENLMNFLWDYGQPATSHDVMEKCATITWSVN